MVLKYVLVTLAAMSLGSAALGMSMINLLK